MKNSSKLWIEVKKSSQITMSSIPPILRHIAIYFSSPSKEKITSVSQPAKPACKMQNIKQIQMLDIYLTLTQNKKSDLKGFVKAKINYFKQIANNFKVKIYK